MLAFCPAHAEFPSMATPSGSPSMAVVYRRRRLVAAVLLTAMLTAGWWALGRLGGSLTTPEPPLMRPAATSVHVVQPGDTLWAIARRYQPTGDVRGLVDRLAADRHGRPLQVGERIAVPVPG